MRFPVMMIRNTSKHVCRKSTYIKLRYNLINLFKKKGNNFASTEHGQSCFLQSGLAHFEPFFDSRDSSLYKIITRQRFKLLVLFKFYRGVDTKFRSAAAFKDVVAIRDTFMGLKAEAAAKTVINRANFNMGKLL